MFTNRVINKLIKIHSVIRCILKIVKCDCYLHHVCPFAMTAPTWQLFMKCFRENLRTNFRFP